MHVPPLFEDLAILFAASLPVVFLCRAAGLSSVVGFIATGIAIGPSGFGLVHSSENVEALAEIGVVLLLFTIGLEMSVSKLVEVRRIVLVAGMLQVGGCVAAVGLIALLAGYAAPQAVTLGFVVSLSSTAIVLKLLTERDQLASPHGTLTLGMLLFQDLAVVPMLLVLPALASVGSNASGGVAWKMLLAMGGIAAVVTTARVVLPRLLRQVLRLRSRELFLGAIAASCFGTAWLTASFGASLAVGAFLAGLVVSESEYSHQAIADIVPLRDLFGSVFFVSIGMLLDLGFVASHGPAVAALVLAIVGIKLPIAAAAIAPFRPSPRIALLAGAALAQVGEFSFVLAEQARRLGLLGATDFQGVLAASVVTMVVTPVVMRAAATVAGEVDLPGPAPVSKGARALPSAQHVVIIGFGFNGRNLARVLRETGIPFVVVEIDVEAARRAAAEGHAVVYGDATRPLVLRHVNVERAAAIVVVIEDIDACRRIVRLIRETNTAAPLLVRTRHVREIEGLLALGADEVIPEEMETSIEMFARVLQSLDVPKNVIAAQVDVIRSEHYALLRTGTPTASRIESIYELFTAATTATHLVRAASAAIGRALQDVGLRSATGVTLVAVVRKGKAVTNPPDDLVIEQGDILVMLGSHAQLAAARDLLDPPAEEPAG